MCGIAGVYRLGDEPLTAEQRAEDRALVDTMLRAIEYRGPDDRGIESVGRVTLGAQRLAILDVAGGHQPLSDVTRRIWATLNGEIYNFPTLRADLATRHPLRTRTDTELLPYLYRERGMDFVQELRGMFGLALYDAEANTLVLARDAMGIKPLYVATVGRRLLYASELKCLLCDPELERSMDPVALSRYLRLGFVPGESTIFRSVRKLRPGTRLIVRPQGIEHRRYQAWPRFFGDAERAHAPMIELVRDAEARIREAVISMMLSDVPVGVLLSGGIDSSLLVALLPKELRSGLRTFSIGADGSGHHDERRYARNVAAYLGTTHREVSLPPNVAEILPRVVSFLDEPCADPASVPAYWVALAASADVKVLLSGTGGDEIFGGYRRYSLGAMLRKARLLPRSVGRGLEAFLGNLDLNRSSRVSEQLIWLRKLMTARCAATPFAAYLAALAPAGSHAWAEAVGGNIEPQDEVLWSELVQEAGSEPRTLEETAFMVDHLYYLPDDLLLKEDRATMGASVEGRFPYLDFPLVQFAAGLPLASRFEGNIGKPILRAIARRYLPLEISQRPKKGFSVPVEEWLRGPLDGLARGVFAAAGSGVFDPAVLRRWHDEHRRGLNRSDRLWTALTFELWWREIGSASPAALAAAGRPTAYSGAGSQVPAEAAPPRGRRRALRSADAVRDKRAA